jgi:protoporphyrinogen oxidase
VAYATEAGARLRFYTDQDGYWVLIDALADALMNKGTLSGSQVRQLLKDTGVAIRN